MGFINIVKNVVTLGGHGVLQDAIARNEQARAEHIEAHQLATSLKGRLDFRLDLLGRTASYSLKRLHRSRKLLNAIASYKLKPFDFKMRINTPSVQNAESSRVSWTLPSEGRIAAGTLVGYASVTGSWTLMTMLGSASTGTALSALSGAAAYNATMAAFGGGTLAAGGLGVAGGAWVLTGIAVIPAVAFAAWSTRSKAKEVNSDTERLEQATQQLVETSDGIKNVGHVSECSRLMILAAWSSLERRDLAARRVLLPWGFVSRIKWFFLKLVGQAQMTEAQQRALSKLDESVYRYSALFMHAPNVGDPRSKM